MPKRPHFQAKASLATSLEHLDVVVSKSVQSDVKQRHQQKQEWLAVETQKKLVEKGCLQVLEERRFLELTQGQFAFQDD